MGKYYLAYGSNLDTDAMAVRSPNAKAVGPAEIDGYELLFKGSDDSAFLTIEQKAGSTVPVAVWQVDADDEMRLDHYEGYPHLYYKDEMEITYTEFDGETEHTVTAFVYIMHEQYKRALPSQTYLRTCLKGYEEFGFDAQPFYEAIMKSVRKVEE